jgi:hypothetical protein
VLGGLDLDLDEGSRDAVSLSATDGRGFAVGLLDAMSYAIRQTCAVYSLDRVRYAYGVPGGVLVVVVVAVVVAMDSSTVRTRSQGRSGSIKVLLSGSVRLGG